MSEASLTKVVSPVDVPSLLQQIYLAIDDTVLDKPGADVECRMVKRADGSLVFDVAGDISEDRMILMIKTIVSAITDFKDLCVAWFRRQGLNGELVTDAFKRSEVLKILADLDNNLKHGESKGDRRTPWSGKSPSLRGVNILVQSNGQGRVKIMPNRAGGHRVEIGSRVLFAEIISETGEHLGLWQQMQNDALKVWVDLLREYAPHSIARSTAR